MKRKTKIVCTLGPATGTREMIFALAKAGMNVARINCSHGDWEHRHQWISWVREASEEIHPIGVLVDLQGPKFRIGKLPVDGVPVETGSGTTIGIDPAAVIPLYEDSVYKGMKPGDRVLLGDGEIELKIGSKRGDLFEAHVVAGGIVQGRKGITVIGRAFDEPCLTEQDANDIVEAANADADFIALSYVRRARDMIALQERIKTARKDIRTCAKIETKEALDNLQAIIHESDVIMVARGDLGLQMDIEDVPKAQKDIINACFRAGKPVITATQMLESMLHNARPTRAEAGDVVNAILDGTDAVMLSGETAAGEYPIEAVAVMDRLALKAESMIEFEDRLQDAMAAEEVDEETDAVAKAAAQLAHTIHVDAIVTTTTSGTTPRLVSRYRPRVPVLCACWQEKAKRYCSVIWGVEAHTMPHPKTSAEAITLAISAFREKGALEMGHRVVVTCGVPPGRAGSTNLILVETIGDEPPL